MFNSRPLRGFLVGVLAAVAVALVALPAVAHDRHTLPQQEAVPQGFDGLSPLVIPAAAFSPRTWGETFSFLGYTRGGYGCVMAPAYLPDGATVEDVYASVYDNDGGGSVRIRMHRADNFDGTTDQMAYLATTGPGPVAAIQVVNDDTINEPEVSYPLYSYYVTTCLDSNDIRLYSVRIYYDTHLYLPAIIRDVVPM